MPAIRFEDMPDFGRMYYEELESHAMTEWHENAHLRDENAKLRELVLELYEDQCFDADQWKYRDRMRDLGIEVTP